MADKDFIEVPEIGLIDKGYLLNRAQLITDRASEKAIAGYPKGSEGLLRSLQQQNERPGTTHYVVVDKYGNSASVTSTIETGFGSRVMVGGFGMHAFLNSPSSTPMRLRSLLELVACSAKRIEGNTAIAWVSESRTADNATTHRVNHRIKRLIMRRCWSP